VFEKQEKKNIKKDTARHKALADQRDSGYPRIRIPRLKARSRFRTDWMTIDLFLRLCCFFAGRHAPDFTVALS